MWGKRHSRQQHHLDDPLTRQRLVLARLPTSIPRLVNQAGIRVEEELEGAGVVHAVRGVQKRLYRERAGLDARAQGVIHCRDRAEDVCPEVLILPLGTRSAPPFLLPCRGLRDMRDNRRARILGRDVIRYLLGHVDMFGRHVRFGHAPEDLLDG